MDQNLLLLVKANCEMVSMEVELLQSAEGKWYDADWREGGSSKGVFRQGGKFASPANSPSDISNKTVSEISKVFNEITAVCDQVTKDQGEQVKSLVFSSDAKVIHKEISKNLNKDSEKSQNMFDDVIDKIEKSFSSSSKSLGELMKDGAGFIKNKVKSIDLDNIDSRDILTGTMAAVGATYVVAAIASYNLLAEDRRKNLKGLGDKFLKAAESVGEDVLIDKLPREYRHQLSVAFKKQALEDIGIVGLNILLNSGLDFALSNYGSQSSGQGKTVLNKLK